MDLTGDSVRLETEEPNKNKHFDEDQNIRQKYKIIYVH